MHHMNQRILLSILFVAFSATAHASNYYVDGSCRSNGNGLADECAPSNGGAGAFIDPQSCFSAVLAGDTCYIKNGTYVTNNRGSDRRVNGGFHPHHSGTATKKIVIRSYPGHKPVLVNCLDWEVRECSHQTISSNRQGHIVYDGLTVIGAFYLLNDPGHPNIDRRIEIKNSDVSVGWFGDGNWAGISLYHWNGAWVHHNRIHSIRLPPGASNTGHAGIKLYSNTGTIVEYNSITPSCADRCQGIDDKEASVNNTHRYNYIDGTLAQAIRINNQLQSRGTQIYGNIISNSREGIDLLLSVDGIAIYNNTFHNVGFGYGSRQPSVTGVRLWNNILNRIGEVNVLFYFGVCPLFSDHNAYQAGKRFRVCDAIFNSLSDHHNATGLEGNSQVVDCRFVNPTAGDFHLQPSSPCRNAGRVGGVPSGTPIDLGAYGVTSCVGHTCTAVPLPEKAVGVKRDTERMGVHP